MLHNLMPTRRKKKPSQKIQCADTFVRKVHNKTRKFREMYVNGQISRIAQKFHIEHICLLYTHFNCQYGI